MSALRSWARALGGEASGRGVICPSPEHFSRKKDHGRAEASLLAVYGASLDLGGRAAL